jgi:hypothetical protein
LGPGAGRHHQCRDNGAVTGFIASVIMLIIAAVLFPGVQTEELALNGPAG